MMGVEWRGGGVIFEVLVGWLELGGRQCQRLGTIVSTDILLGL